MSTPPTADHQTLAAYNVHAADYAALEIGKEDWGHLEMFAARLAPGARVLDFGCGPGVHTKWLLDAGFDVVALDGSAGLAAEAHKRTGLDIRIARFDELEDVAAFDAIWAAHTLHHVPHDGLPDVLQRMVRALKPNGEVFAAVKGGGGEHRDRFDRLYAYHSVSGFTGVLEAAGLVVDRVETYSGVGFDGSPCRVLAVFGALAQNS